MATKSPVKTTALFNLGDRVRIKDLAGQVGRIAELRGPLGPAGAPVYRVRVRRKQTAYDIELMGDQIEYLPMMGQVVGAKTHKASPKPPRVKRGG